MRSSSRSTRAAGALALACAASLAAHTPAQALPRTLPPVDQCAAVPGFAQFRARLKRAVAKRDRAALLALLAPDVMVSFGGDTGRAAFAKAWSFDPAERGNIWDQLERMLKLGCARSGGALLIPSLAAQFEGDEDADVFETVILLPGARLHRETGVESADPRIAPWSVARVNGKSGDTITGVRLADGREGYVADEDLYSPLGYRMVIAKRRGRWLITAFVAGD